MIGAVFSRSRRVLLDASESIGDFLDLLAFLLPFCCPTALWNASAFGKELGESDRACIYQLRVSSRRLGPGFVGPRVSERSVDRHVVALCASPQLVSFGGLQDSPNK